MSKISNKIDFEIDSVEIEKRKNRIRNTWEYKRVDHIPIGIYVVNNKEGFSRQEIEKDKAKNLKFDLNNIKKSLQLLEDDYIPFIKPEVGCCTIPSILGCEVDYTKNFSNYSTVKEPVVFKMEDLDSLYIPVSAEEISARGLMPLNLEKIHYYQEITNGTIDFTGFDIGGVMCGSVDIMDTNLFYISLISEQERMLVYLEKLSDLYVSVQDILTGEIGNINRMMNIDWDVSWYPEGHKGYVSDDPCANFGPDTFEIFSKPFNSKIYDIYGYGGFHNCGPHPCASSYLDYNGSFLKAINCSLQYTYKQIDDFMDTFRGREVILYFLFEEEFYNAEKAIGFYRELVEKGTARNLVCIPCYPVDASIYSDSQIKDIFDEFLKISRTYADSLDLK